MTSEARPTTLNQSAHSYATRVRHNTIPTKPSIRLRLEKPAEPARALQPAPIPREDQEIPASDLAPFPSPNVVLHPDDANSKVFHAIARSLLSVVRCLPLFTLSFISDSLIPGQSGHDGQRFGRDVHNTRSPVSKVRVFASIDPFHAPMCFQLERRVPSHYNVHTRPSQALRARERSTASLTPYTFRHSNRRPVVPGTLFHVWWRLPLYASL